MTWHQNRCHSQHSHITLVPVAPAKQKKGEGQTDLQKGIQSLDPHPRVVPVTDAAAQTQHPFLHPADCPRPTRPTGSAGPREGPPPGSSHCITALPGPDSRRTAASSLSRELWAMERARPSAGWAWLWAVLRHLQILCRSRCPAGA